ncbi:MAG: hypothetical protein HYT09_01040 [Candidatus Levybacteria bacterium]|nr:hypothetical protein [Candidatus Levybacteria bacterium]
MKLIIVVFIAFFLAFTPLSVLAVENPLDKPNNKIGIHILFPSELEDASKLVNSSGGSWGYVTIPIQSGDKDLEKWQIFMDDARRLRLIPIIRLSTEGNYFNTSVWRKPEPSDVVDFANFLNSLDWPIKNRYIVVFNEVNRGDEWGGSPDPADYANLLNLAVSVFKSRNSDFFIISGGLDNASADIPGQSINSLNFLSLMNDAVPGIFNQVDGLSSHAYPNPGFSQPPDVVSSSSIVSYRFEKETISNFSNKNHPIFITEAGWPTTSVLEEKASEYLKKALDEIWTDGEIVAITPFLLKAGSGPFEGFSFIKNDGTNGKYYQAIENFKKISGKPTINKKSVLGKKEKKDLPIIDFRSEEDRKIKIKTAEILFRFLIRF